VLAAYVALALLRLIGLFTNLFFFQRWDSALVSPAGAETGFTRFPVVERGEGRRLVGMVALRDLLEARVRNLEPSAGASA